MEISFAVPSLDTLDATEGDVLAVSLFEDERPPHGLTGLVDWRLNGRLSRWLVQDRFAGSYGEALLYPPDHRMAAKALLVLGLGPPGHYTPERYRETCASVVDRAAALGAARLSMALPGFRRVGMPGRMAVEILLRELVRLEAACPGAALTLMEPPDARRDMEEPVRAFLRRGQV